MAVISFQLESGVTAPSVDVFFDRVDSNPDYVPGGATWTSPEALPGSHVTFKTVDGYWEAVVSNESIEQAGHATVTFSALPASGPYGWWHQLLNVTANRRVNRGSEMRIGVIDEGLRAQPEGSCISHVINEGGSAWSQEEDDAAFNPNTDHGEKVCALIASRADGARGFAGVAPGAEVYFASAHSPANARNGGSRLWISRVGDCIQHLAFQRDCDVLSISAGDLPEASPYIGRAVQRAADRGAVCFFAAGNSSTPMYPALQDDCHAVAAIGKAGYAPDRTRIKWVDEQQSVALNLPKLYVWKYSGCGPKIDFCAPGVGVIFSRRHRAAGALVGTSFACPLAAATAALILEKDEDYMSMDRSRARYDRALKVLIAASQSFGGGGTLWRYGLLRL